jgi:spore coat protein U-like protein
MHSKMKNGLRAIVFAWLIVYASVAQSQSVAGSNCTMTVVPVSFGLYNPIDDVDLLNESGSVRMQCFGPNPGGVSYSIALGTGSSNSYSPRTLRVATYFLEYNLYTASNRAIVWGDGSSGSSIVGATIQIPANASVDGPIHTIYSRIIKRQYKPGGLYGDNLPVIVNF